MEIRENAAAINGSPLTIMGTPVQSGDLAPEVTLRDGALTGFKLLEDTKGKIRLISVVPCLDTGLCEMQTLRMSKEASRFDDRVVVVTVSTDLPAAQWRWCGRTGVENVIMLSDHMDMAFGSAYGTWLRELRAEQRSVFVVDAEGFVRHAEYIPEVGHAIDYDRALAVVNDLLEEPKPA